MYNFAQLPSPETKGHNYAIGTRGDAQQSQNEREAVSQLSENRANYAATWKSVHIKEERRGPRRLLKRNEKEGRNTAIARYERDKYTSPQRGKKCSIPFSRAAPSMGPPIK